MRKALFVLFTVCVCVSAQAEITIEGVTVLDTDSSGYSPNLTSLGTADWVVFGKNGSTWTEAEKKNTTNDLISIVSQSTAGSASSGNTSNRFTWSDGMPTASASSVSVNSRLQVSSGGADIDTDVTIAVSTLEAGKPHRFFAWLGSKRQDVNVSYSVDGGNTFVGIKTYTGGAGSTTYEHQYVVTFRPSDVSDKLYVRFEWNLAAGATGQQQALFDAVALNAPLNEAPAVDAGGRYQVTGMTDVHLGGSYTDDGVPAGGEVTVNWRMVAADDPNYVIDDPSLLDAVINFDQPGFYSLELTVNDGEVPGSDQTLIRAKDETLIDALQAHFRCDSDANDVSDEYHQYTSVEGSPEIVAGKVGGAASLGKGDKLTYGTQLGAETSISVSFWMNPAGDVGEDKSKGIVSKYSGNSNDPQGGWTFQYRSENLMRFRCDSGYNGGAGDMKIEVPGLFPKGAWTHIVGTFDGQTGEMRFYVNSELAGSRTTDLTSFDPVTELQIGSDEWSGMVDDIFVYDYVISAAELRFLYTRAGNAPPIVDIIEDQAKVVLPDNVVTLTGVVLDENDYTVAWTVEEKPADAAVTFDGPVNDVWSVELDTVGNYVLRMTATDVEGLSNDDDVVVKVRPAGFDGMEAHITFAGKDPNSHAATGIDYPAAFLGDPSWTTRGNDDPNDALLLDGTDDALDYGKYLGSDPECTIMAWIKPEDLSRNQFILSKWSAGLSGDGWMIRIRGDGNVAAMIGSYFSGNGVYLQVIDPHTDQASPLTAGEWAHVGVTFDGNTMTLYQNGVPVSRESDLEYSAGDVVTPMVIGYRTSTGAEYFDGAIDEVRIYDYALTDEEIEAIYTGDGGTPWVTCNPQLVGDLTGDCRVDLADFAQAGSGWSDVYDLSDIADIAAGWLTCDDFDVSNCPLYR